ncbi:MAG: hypothetical protein HC859_11260 [Bacteroidia bacterium]|nr:hypothetical protein [Bacteroidia bacterium]
MNNPTGNTINFSTNIDGSSTLAAGRTITIGGSGFPTGTLNLNRFTQLGATAQILTLTGTGALNLGPTSAFGGDVTFTAPDIILNGCTFDGTATLTKNGNTSSTGAGNNIFNGTTLITNSGSGNFRTNGSNTFNASTTLTNTGSADILLELNTGSTYNGSLTINSLGSGYIRVGYNGTNTFNGNIDASCTNGNGVYFSENTAGTSTLTAGHTIAVGASGFSNGTLNLNRFTQMGATPQALTLTGTGHR